ncbi:type I-E CRISPR-associated protein Cas6/Cse3/CasE [Pokkaliibacter sp. MBI-7]|uniref:type I-E CRISPR-associated protein Cas6/Cse3/CasE n=1 Tax=Pokkaliibacter sp. MBI-7 TaxID=3040600 RepID=UPI00244AFE6D|nr:type I-E CRISPR-associated protein Cas6/Cse3/CasE [Pokkaliibacter sp. MBI-7]MDH2436469.1 type I-E CRISPR-associated protein Cas6/Cse3/CasE [Pokkaliibacter sp. MBI-7]
MYLSRVMLKPDIINNTQLSRVLADRTYGVHRLLWDLFDQPERDFLYREEVAREQVAQPGVKGEPVYYLLSPQPPKTDSPLFEVQSKPFRPDFTAGQHLSFRLRANPVVTRDRQRHDLVMDEQRRFLQRLCEAQGLAEHGGKADMRKRLLETPHPGALHDWLSSYLSQTRYFAESGRRHTLHTLLDLAMQEAIAQRLMHWLTQNPSRQGIFTLAERVIEDDFTDDVRTVPAFEWQAYNAHPIPEKAPSAAQLAHSKHKARFLSVDMSGELIVTDPQRFTALLQQGIGAAKGFGCGLMLVKPVHY